MTAEERLVEVSVATYCPNGTRTLKSSVLELDDVEAVVYGRLCDFDRMKQAATEQLEFWGESVWGEAFPISPSAIGLQNETIKRMEQDRIWLERRLLDRVYCPRPPVNAEYVLYIFLTKNERECAIGDIVEEYGHILRRFNKRRADIWFYKQVAGSLLPLLRRALLRIGALVWLSRILRRLIS